MKVNGGRRGSGEREVQNVETVEVEAEAVKVEEEEGEEGGRDEVEVEMESRDGGRRGGRG